MRNLARTAIVSILMLAGTSTFAQRLQVYYFQRPPLYFTEADGSPGGFLNEIARLILDDAKVSSAFVEMPSTRVEPSLWKMSYAAGIGWFKTAARERLARFSAPIYQDLPLVAVVNSARARALGHEATIDRILGSGLTLGTIQGFSYGDFADKAIARLKPKLETIVGEQSALVKMVARGRADILLLGLEEAGYLMENDRESGAALRIVKISDAPAGTLRYIMFSKGVDAATVARIDAAIGRVKRSRAYRRLVDFSRYLK